MSTAPLCAVWFLLYLVSCILAGGLTTFLTRSWMAWRLWEVVLLLLPFLVWSGAIAINSTGKTLSNAVIEPLVCGLLSSLQLLIRIYAVKVHRTDHILLVPLGVLVSCLAVLVVYWTMPALPE